VWVSLGYVRISKRCQVPYCPELHKGVQAVVAGARGGCGEGGRHVSETLNRNFEKDVEKGGLDNFGVWKQVFKRGERYDFPIKVGMGGGI